MKIISPVFIKLNGSISILKKYIHRIHFEQGEKELVFLIYASRTLIYF